MNEKITRWKPIEYGYNKQEIKDKADKLKKHGFKVLIEERKMVGLTAYELYLAEEVKIKDSPFK